MRLIPAIALALVLAQPAATLFCQTQASSPQPTYLLHVPGLRLAEMSPDERYLAAFAVNWPKGAPATAELQVWDFRGGILLHSHPVPAPEASPGKPRGTPYFQYTSDSQFLILYTGGEILHVLRATDLEEARTLRIQAHAKINALEVSPTAHRVAVCLSGEVRVYDLDSGDEVRSWTIHPHSKTSGLFQVHPQWDRPGLAWRADGGVLAVSIADNSPCLTGGGTIYIFDSASNQDPTIFRVSLLPSSIVFGTGNSLYVASNTCGGYFTHWTLDLPIFDSTSGKRIGEIPAGKVGFRGYIAISSNRQFLVVHADREKTTFAGFEDTLSVTDEQWQVWDLSAKKLVLTLPVESFPSVSSFGHFLYVNRLQDLEVLSVPTVEK